MKSVAIQKIFLGSGLLLVSGWLVACGGLSQQPASEAKIFLVRHAEKILDGIEDPALTKAGYERARQLSERLRDEHITVIYSTQYVRTQQTAAPLAEALNLSVIPYDPGNLSGFAQKLLAGHHNALVVGHSNTTPSLVEILSGQPVEPIDEAREYDRLYVITVQQDGTVTSQLERYGTLYQPR